MLHSTAYLTPQEKGKFVLQMKHIFMENFKYMKGFLA